jgi:hypothetical protein
MLGRSNSGGISNREAVSRQLQRAGRVVAGETGGRVANKISKAIRCGTVDICDDPACQNCAPVRD